jgi:serine/threonine protein kinase
LVDDEDRKRPIGTGVWSDVYLAVPSTPKPTEQPFLLPPSAADSPIKSNDSAIEMSTCPDIPPLYAIKAPASTSSRKVLKEEAKVLSYLSQFPDSNKHIVKFFGQDTRNDALVLKAMDGTLEDWIKKNLNNLPEGPRAAKLATVFPTIALALIDSLIWMQDKNCIHADIKPANVLTSLQTNNPPPENPVAPVTVYSDFSSTILSTPDLEVHNPSPLGAGTWDYLDPSLLSSLTPAEPSPATDLWSLAITLLFLVIGASPFDAFRHNKFQQREMIKSGSPLQCLAYDDVGMRNVRRMKELSGTLGMDLNKWFGKVLVKDVGKRVGVVEWRDELASATVAGLGSLL